MTEKTTERSFGGDFRRFFGRGLGILLPSIVTLWLLYQVFLFLFANVAQPINYGIRSGILWSTETFIPQESQPKFIQVTEAQIERRVQTMASNGEVRPEELENNAEAVAARARKSLQRDNLRRVWNNEHPYLQLTGLIVAIVLIYLAGLLLGNYIGRTIYVRVEKLISKIPGFKQVYPHVKQVVDLIFGDSPMKAFSEVVLVQYPREGIWTIGLVTGEGFQELREEAGGEIASVFIPTSPTPMTGFVINARRSEIRKMDMTVDQALRFVITAGVLTPETAAPNPDEPIKLPNAAVKLDRDDKLQAAVSPAGSEPPKSDGAVSEPDA
ncbi:MAG: DUF502 domain-containing protein [Planctomycetota bacterium]